jgi:hypothetical protein
MIGVTKSLLFNVMKQLEQYQLTWNCK